MKLPQNFSQEYIEIKPGIYKKIGTERYFIKRGLCKCGDEILSYQWSKTNYCSTICFNKYKIISETTKNKIRQYNLGKKASCATKLKLSIIHSGKNNYWFGKKMPHHNKTVESRKLNGSYVAWNKGMKLPNFSPANGFKKGNHPKSEFKKGNVSWSTGKKYPLESKQKMSESAKHRYAVSSHPMLGKKHSASSIVKMQETHKKIVQNPEYKKLISMRLVENAKINPNFGMKGKKQSEYAKASLKERRKYQVFPVKDTSIEVKIQNYLKELNVDFFTHQYMDIGHGYQCDIFVPGMDLVIECDGDYWHKYPVGKEIDHIRTKELIEKGFKVLRLWENEIKTMDVKSFENKLFGVLT